MGSTGLKVKRPRMTYVFEDGVPRGAWVMSLECREKNDILGVLALKLEPLEPIMSPKHPLHSSKASTVKGQSVELPKTTSQASSCKVPCYASWSIEYRGRITRIISVNVLEPAILPDWESLTLLRQFSAPEANHLQAPTMYSHIWFRLPDDGLRPRWRVLGLWPKDQWNSEDLILDLGFVQSNGYIKDQQPLGRTKYAAVALSDPLMGFEIAVYMTQCLTTLGIEKYNVKVFPRFQSLHWDWEAMRPPAKDFLDLTGHIRVKVAVESIKRAGLHIAHVITTVEYRENCIGKTLGFNKAPHELVASNVDIMYFEKQIKVTGARDEARKKGNVTQDHISPDARIANYAELLKMEECERAAKIATKKDSKKISNAAVARWTENQI